MRALAPAGHGGGTLPTSSWSRAQRPGAGQVTQLRYIARLESRATRVPSRQLGLTRRYRHACAALAGACRCGTYQSQVFSSACLARPPPGDPSGISCTATQGRGGRFSRRGRPAPRQSVHNGCVPVPHRASGASRGGAGEENRPSGVCGLIARQGGHFPGGVCGAQRPGNV